MLSGLFSTQAVKRGPSNLQLTIAVVQPNRYMLRWLGSGSGSRPVGMGGNPHFWDLKMTLRSFSWVEHASLQSPKSGLGFKWPPRMNPEADFNENWAGLLRPGSRILGIR